jgi:Na+-translocating ferredoxin:NAD+ oxidoreductase subunit G
MDTRSAGSAARRALHAAVVLTVVAVTAVALVSVVHDRSEPRIEASRRAQQLAQLTTVLGDLAFDNDPLTDTVQLHDPELLGSDEPLAAHRVRRADTTVAVLLNVVAPDGYAGPIRLLVAVDGAGRVLGVRALEHRETPGLGDLIESRRSDWIDDFGGRSLGDPPTNRWAVRRDGGDFDQFTGATVTPRAVVGAVRKALIYVGRHRDELFASAQPSAP